MKYSCRFFENRECEFFPCHKGIDALNCLFCYCPLYEREGCPGNPSYVTCGGIKIKDCSGCTFPHEPENYEKILLIMKNRR